MKLKNALDVGGRQVVNICKNKSKPKSIRDRYAHRGMKMTADRHTDRLLKLDELITAGDLETAKALQYDINNIIYTLCAGKGHMYAVIKAVLEKREGLAFGGVRAPLATLFEQDAAVVDKAVAMIDEVVAKYL